MSSDDQLVKRDVLFRCLIGKRIRGMRNKAGMSQTDLGSKLGDATQDTLTRLECGTAKTISFKLLLDLCEYCTENGRSLNWLIFGNDPDVREQLLSEIDATHPDVINEAAVAIARRQLSPRFDATPTNEAGNDNTRN